MARRKYGFGKSLKDNDPGGRLRGARISKKLSYSPKDRTKAGEEFGSYKLAYAKATQPRAPKPKPAPSLPAAATNAADAADITAKTLAFAAAGDAALAALCAAHGIEAETLGDRITALLAAGVAVPEPPTEPPTEPPLEAVIEPELEPEPADPEPALDVAAIAAAVAKLWSLNKTDLVDLAASRDLELSAELTKAELVQALAEAGVFPQETESDG